MLANERTAEKPPKMREKYPPFFPFSVGVTNAPPGVDTLALSRRAEKLIKTAAITAAPDGGKAQVEKIREELGILLGDLPAARDGEVEISIAGFCGGRTTKFAVIHSKIGNA